MIRNANVGNYTHLNLVFCLVYQLYLLISDTCKYDIEIIAQLVKVDELTLLTAQHW